MDGVVESAVVGMPYPDFGEAGLRHRAAGRELSAAAMLSELKGRLANYKVPKQMVFVPELPRNAMGKVQKNVLRDSYAEMWKQSLEKAS